MEAWTLKKIDTKRIEAFEMWMNSRILIIPWTERVTKVEVLRRMQQKEKELIVTIKKCNTWYML